MIRWLGISLLFASVIVKLTWHSSADLAIAMRQSHRGYPVTSVVFWVLLIVGLGLIGISLVKHTPAV